MSDTRVDRVSAAPGEVVIHLHVVVHGLVDRFNPVRVSVRKLRIVRSLDTLRNYAVYNTERVHFKRYTGDVAILDEFILVVEIFEERRTVI